MREDDEAEQKSGHQAIIDDSWLRCREFIRRAEAVDMDPTQVLWPVEDPHPHYPRALKAHAATIQFRDDIFAYRNENANVDISELWNETVHTISMGDEKQQMAVSLANLDDWAHNHYTETSSEVSLITGQQQITRKYRVLLPVAACRRLYRHMQDILRELGFTAATKDHTPEGEAKPEHLVGLLTERGQKEAKGQLPARFTKGNPNGESET